MGGCLILQRIKYNKGKKIVFITPPLPREKQRRRFSYIYVLRLLLLVGCFSVVVKQAE